MKKLIAILAVIGLLPLLSNGQGACNSNISICTPGVAGPFNFDPLATGPPIDYANPVGCSTGMFGNPNNFGFIVLNITTSGPLNLLIDGNAGTGFLDIVVYNVPAGMDPCVAAMNSANEIGCNYAPASAGCNQFGNDFPCPSSVPAPIVNAGDVLMIIVHDYSTQSTSFTLDLGPTGAQTGPPNPVVTAPGSMATTDPPATVTSTVGGGTWSASCGACIDATTGVFDPAIAGPGAHTVCFDVGAAPCNAQDCQVITVVSPCNLTLLPTSTDVTCFGQSDGSVDAGLVGGTAPITYNWSNGATTSTSAGIVAGNYTVTVIDGNGCNSDTNITVNEPANVVSIATSNDTTICLTGTAMLAASGSGGNGAPYTLNWTALAGNGPHNVNPMANTCYIVSATDPLGCTSILDSVCVSLNPALSVQVSPDDSICAGYSTTISANAFGGDGGPYTYTWTTLAGTPMGIGNSVTVTPGASGTQYLVTVTDGCETPPALDTITIFFYQIPAPTFTSDIVSGCYPIDVLFTNTTPAGASAGCFWDFGNGTSDNTCNPGLVTYSSPGSYDVVLTVTSPGGCVSSVTELALINVFDYPTADFTFGPQPVDVLGPDVNFTNNSSADANAFLWEFGTDGILGTDVTNNPMLTFPDDVPGTYPVELTVTNADGCQDSVTYNVIIDGVFTWYAPNTFTPNNDGINDLFYVQGESIDGDEFELQVFDRWGGIVFATDSPTGQWDGTFKNNGNPVMSGDYAWRLRTRNSITGERVEYKGHVTLLK